MARIDKIEITPVTLAKVGQAVDYRYRIRGSVLADEDGADLVGTLGELYRWLSQKHLEAAYEGEDIWKGNPHQMTQAELDEAFTTLEQFDMLKLLYKDESHTDKEGN